MRSVFYFIGGLVLIFALAVAAGPKTIDISRRLTDEPEARGQQLVPNAPERGDASVPYWKQVGVSQTPKEYYQGMTSDKQSNFYFDGVLRGLYKTNSSLEEVERNVDFIPENVRRTEGYNRLGDLTWDRAEGGRLLLPLSCFYPEEEDDPNTCATAAIAVGDPDTLQWRYYVKLDPRQTESLAWSEVSPSGELLWVSSGRDLLAYRTADIAHTNAAPAGPPIQPVRRLRGAVPPSGITGATFYGELLLVAGHEAGPFQVWSLDPADGSRHLQIEREIVGRSKGLDAARALGGLLHWQVVPDNDEGRRPTYSIRHTTLIHFVLESAAENRRGGASQSKTSSLRTDWTFDRRE